MNVSKNKVLLGAAVAGLLGAVMTQPVLAAKEKDVPCAGVNACKGHSSCKGANNACKGQNGCKGQGVVNMSKEACDAIGGAVTSSKPPMAK